MEKFIRLGLLLTAVWVGGSAWAANPYVVLPTGEKMEGSRVRVMEDGQVILTTKEGQLTFPKGTRVVVEAPPELAKARDAVERKQYDTAQPLLEGIVKEYRFMEWDIQARGLLIRLLVAKQDFKAAVRAYEKLRQDAPNLKIDENGEIGYLRALAATGEQAKLAPLLDKAITDGTRHMVAVAQVLRGNARLAGGDVEGALMDFLRTAEFFKEFKDARPEALCQAALCMDKLKNTGAEALKMTLRDEFPGNEFTKKLN